MKIDEKLGEILDLAPTVVTEQVIVPIIKQEPENTDVENDYQNTRRTLNRLIEKGMDALDNLTHVAKETENPYAYLVTATMIKNLADVTRELLDGQKKVKELEAPKLGNQAGAAGHTINVDKAVFVGSTKELLQRIKEDSK